MSLLRTAKDEILFGSLVVLVALMMLAFNESIYWRSSQSLEVLASMSTSRATVVNLLENTVSAVSSQRAYVLTGNEPALDRLDVKLSTIATAFESLAQQDPPDATYMAALARFRAKVTDHLATANEGVQLRRAGRLEEAIGIVLQRVGTLDAIYALDDELHVVEIANRDHGRATVAQSLMAGRIGVAVLTLASLLALLVYRHQARQIENHQEALRAIERTLRDKLEAEVTLRTAELTNLTRYLLHAREDERNRLARNLHDDLGALLTSAKLNAARIKPRLARGEPQALELLAYLVANLDACVALGRNIIENLRPSALSNLGLAATLEILAREFSENSGIKVQCQLEPVTLDANAELTAYRIVQEALTNINKYAQASQIWITLASHKGQAVISVRDNGVGFDPQIKPNAAYGLLGMRFRVEAAGGVLNIVSAPKAGTTVIATLNQRLFPALAPAPALTETEG